MSMSVLRPRLATQGASGVTIRPRGYSPLGVTAFFVLATAVIAVVAFVAESVALQVGTGLLAVAVLGCGVGLRGVMESASPRSIRIDPSPGGVRFTPTRAVRSTFLVLGLLLLAPAVAFLILRYLAIPSAGPVDVERWYVLGIGLVGVGVVAHEVWILRVPAGLTLTEHGVSGTRGAGRIRLTWDEVATVGVVDLRGAHLLLTTTSGERIRIAPYWIGSDPNVVAPIVRYFLHDPARRHLLGGDPRAAIRRVEEAAAGSEPG